MPEAFKFASSLLHYDLVRYQYEDAIKNISAVGYEGVELHTPPPPHEMDWASLRRLLKKLDLEPASVTCQRWAWAHDNEQAVRETLDTFEKAVLLAEYLDSSRVMMETGTFPESMGHEDATLMAARNVATATDFASDHGIKVVILECDSNYIVNDTKTFLKFRKLVGASNLYPNVDPSNYIMAGEDPAKALLIYGPLLKGIHVKDGTKKPMDWTPIGEGEVDWRAFLSAAMKIGYHDWLVTEYEGGIWSKYYSDPEKASKDTLAYLKKVVREVKSDRANK